MELIQRTNSILITEQLAVTVKLNDVGILGLNVFDEPTRNVLQGQTPGTINAVLGEGNVRTFNLDEEAVTLTKLSQDVSGLNNYSTIPTFTNGILTKVEELDGAIVKKRTLITYNADGTVNTVTVLVIGKTVISTMNYINGEFSSASKHLIEGGL